MAEIIKDHIDRGKGFDWGRASADYAKFRDIYPPIFYEKLLELKIGISGQSVLDIGTGTGVIPRNLHKHGARLIGADISENQIAQARRLSAEAGMDIDYVVSPAEELDFPTESFDAITACQCYIYFDKNVIFKKFHELLKNGGRFCKMSMIWLIEESEIAAQTEKIVLKHNPDWSDHSLKRYTEEFPGQAKGLFEEAADFIAFDVPVTFTRESWHGRIKACRGIGASSLSAEQIAEFEREHLEYMQTLPPSFDIPHYITLYSMKKISNT